MKYVFKKNWYCLLIILFVSLPLLIVGTIRTDKTLTLKGGTSLVTDFVEIEDANPQLGSLSTIYVYSVNHSTVLQNMIASMYSSAEIENLPPSYLHLTAQEMALMGEIQHDSSIMYSLITSYQAAGKYLAYSYDSYIVAFYLPVSEFKIGDRIIGVKNADKEYYIASDFDSFAENFNLAINTRDGKMEFIVERDDKIYNFANTEDNLKIAGYNYFNLDENSSTPRFKINKTNVGGPSGGLLQTLYLYNALTVEDITKGKMIAGTGTIELDGSVGEIGGIKQKIYAAYDAGMEIFLCPAANYDEALVAYNKLKDKRMKLYKVATFAEALEVLKNV